MLNETVTQSHVLLPGVEQSFGLLGTPHALAEILVNPNGASEAGGSEWRLYDVGPAGPALIWRGDLTPPFQGTQRLTPDGGIAAGGRFELRAISRADVPTAAPVTATLIGYDPACCDGGEPDPEYLLQPDWYLNAETGNDTRDGATPAMALRTFAELTRRLGTWRTLTPAGGVLSIYVLTSMPPDDPFTLLAVAGPDVIVRVVGTVTPVDPSAFTAVTPQDPALNQPNEVTDVAATWGAESRIALGTGAFAWGAKDLGAGVLRTSNFALPDPGALEVIPQVPAVEPYVIQDLVTIAPGAIQILGSTSSGSGFVLLFQDLTFYDGIFALPTSTVRIIFSGCKIDPFYVTSPNEIYYLNCCLSSTESGGAVFALGVNAQIHAGIATTFFFPTGGDLQLDADFMLQGAHIETDGGGSLKIGQACGFDSPEHGLHVHPSCVVECIDSAYGAARLWGVADPGAHGVDLDAGGLLRLGTGITPTLTGGLGDFILSGAATARAWNEGGGAYTAPIACTWGDFDAGLLRNAHNVAQAAAIVGLP